MCWKHNSQIVTFCSLLVKVKPQKIVHRRGKREKKGPQVKRYSWPHVCCLCGWRCTLLLHHGVLLRPTFAELHRNKHKKSTRCSVYTHRILGYILSVSMNSTETEPNASLLCCVSAYPNRGVRCMCLWPYLSSSGGSHRTEEPQRKTSNRETKWKEKQLVF